MDKKTEFYKKLKVQLEDTMDFPDKYLFKFIVPTDTDKIKAIEDSFNHSGAVINKKQSKNGKYTSVSILVEMPNAESIISKYKEVSHIEGVISL
ncbi:MAG: hypothetical protein CSA39_06830 [Flavobacteriales bacterium]|nr:MAG: hypothetical protein CSA39_06830 [Flavobacteriales bacterium]